MLNSSNKCYNRIKLAGALALLASGASAKFTVPLVQCKSTVFQGATVCAVDMSSYVRADGNGLAQCPAGATSTGPTVLCQQNFAAAIKDAKLYFATASQPLLPYVIKVPRGTHDFSSQPHALPWKKAAIDISGIGPTSDGCLAGNPAADGVVTLSGNPCFVISGAGARETTLITANGLTGIAGGRVSHVLIENMTMIQPNHSATQGTYVSQASRTFGGLDYTTLTLDIAAGFPTPLDLYNINCAANGDLRCSDAGLSTVTNNIYMRAYTNTAAPKLIQSTSDADSNAQNPWGYPSLGGAIRAAVKPTQPDAANFPDRWTITLSTPVSNRDFPSVYSETTGGALNLICMKVDHASAFWFDDNPSGGTDVIMNNMVWIGAARGTFRGIRGGLADGTLGVQVYNSSIERDAPVGGQVPCLSSQSGGMQIGNPNDAPIYGNAVFGLKAEATGDDSLAMFNDIGGKPVGDGTFYPQTYIRQSVIGNSFARDILLMTNHHNGGLYGASAVIVDAFTQGTVTDEGNCDPLVLGGDNCPVTYVND